jgi:hypothetical protein
MLPPFKGNKGLRYPDYFFLLDSRQVKWITNHRLLLGLSIRSRDSGQRDEFRDKTV